MPTPPLERLRTLVNTQMNVMTGVATHELDIKEFNDDYRERQRNIRQLCNQLGLDYLNPFDDLWEWYGKWKEDLPSYQSRREFISKLFKRLLRDMETMESQVLDADLPGSDDLEGWPAVDNQVEQLKVRLATCETPEDAQAVGLLCRDIMVSLAEATFQENLDGDGSENLADKLHAVANRYAPGSSNAKLRKLVKSTVDYANVVQHRREGKVEEAALAAEATVAAVRIMRRLRLIWLSDLPF